jgi:hypothetical protein
VSPLWAGREGRARVAVPAGAELTIIFLI